MTSGQIRARKNELKNFLNHLNVAQGLLGDRMSVVNDIKNSATAGLNVDGVTFGESELDSVNSILSSVSGDISDICANVQAELARLERQLTQALAREAAERAAASTGSTSGKAAAKNVNKVANKVSGIKHH